MGAAPKATSTRIHPARAGTRSKAASSARPIPNVSATKSSEGGYFVTFRKPITVSSGVAPTARGWSP